MKLVKKKLQNIIEVKKLFNMKIYDCFQFFNELDLLEIRLDTLYDHVDYFVLSESNKTHSNNVAWRKGIEDHE